MRIHIVAVLLASLALVDSRRMRDSKEWTTKNLNLESPGSYCYDDKELNCRRYGRLYTWESAARGCQALGLGWGLPTADDWRQMPAHYGGIRDESPDLGKASFIALSSQGRSGFSALLGGRPLPFRPELVRVWQAPSAEAKQ